MWGRNSNPSLPTFPALEGLTDHFPKKGPVNCYPERLHRQAGSLCPLGEHSSAAHPQGPLSVNVAPTPNPSQQSITAEGLSVLTLVFNYCKKKICHCKRQHGSQLPMLGLMLSM